MEDLVNMCKTPEAQEKMRQLTDELIQDIQNITKKFVGSILSSHEIMSQIEKDDPFPSQQVSSFSFAKPKKQNNIFTPIKFGQPINGLNPQAPPWTHAGSPFPISTPNSFNFGQPYGQTSSISFGFGNTQTPTTISFTQPQFTHPSFQKQ